MANGKEVLFLVDRQSFPVKCAELDDFITLVASDYEVEYLDQESPTYFFREAMKRVDNFELVIPVTRNMFIRDRLRREGVNLIVCL